MPTSKIAQSRNCVKQLQYEIEKHETMQPNALSAVRFHRFDLVSFHFCCCCDYCAVTKKRFKETQLLWLCLSCPLLSKREKNELKTRASMLAMPDSLCVNEISFLSQEVNCGTR